MKRAGKLLKRVLVSVAGLVGVLIVLCAVALTLLMRTPQWYHAIPMTTQEREEAAQRATNKLAMIQNEAARIRAQERRDRSSTSPATMPAEPSEMTVSFTDRELNAFFDKWATLNNWKGTYEQYVTTPVVVLQEGRMILAAQVRELSTIVSLHFRPRLDEHGQLHVELERIRGGNLPLPEGIFSGRREELVQSIRAKLPEWRSDAALDRSGMPNTSAVAATMASLLTRILEQEPGEPVLFLPLVDRGTVAVKLVDMEIQDHNLTMTIRPLSIAERRAMLTRIKADNEMARVP